MARKRDRQKTVNINSHQLKASYSHSKMILLTHSKDLVKSTHNMKNPKAMKQASRTIITSIPVHVKQISTKSHLGEFGEILIKADYFIPPSPATSPLA